VNWERPPPADVWRSIEAYLALAYDDGPPPGPVLERLSRLRATPGTMFYACEAFERLDDGFALRLGNRFYAHMKLVVEPSSAGVAHFRVDTHDRHFLDLVGAPGPGLVELMDRNLAIARSIDEAWSALGLRVSGAQWRDALARWRALHR
jgi:hypothetical protein